MLRTYQAKDWFFHHVGFSERIDNIYKYMKLKDDGYFQEVESKINGKKYGCGHFSIRDIKSFNCKPRGKGRFNIIRGNRTKSTKLELVDVMKMQNLRDFNGSTFQCASNFNCLEFASHLESPSSGISRYSTDFTQGPTLSVSSFGALLYRNYFVDHEGHKGQLSHDINLLSRTPLKVIKGKVFLNTKEEISKLNEFDFRDENNYQIGVHEKVQITTDRVKGHEYKDSERNQFVNQLFCSSYSFGDYCDINNKNVISSLENLLKTEYKLSILSGIENSIKYRMLQGSDKLVLTCLGVGYFNNPPELICRSIKANRELIHESGLDVYLVCFSDDDQRGFKSVYPHLVDLVSETKGEIISAF
ncbi:hypothetical protein TVAG_151260 [Trichomonas vaginalis G3]|uniref:Uncharacterized protein n=2 Tax=Trichomonas vaginalis (strain ATCC PRA-98 / G3) TaxID=412133 RepID=A2EQC3_TRIV3|nr:hypothetical protein TVAGG3_0726600 [Trichomonas vaginalis G3]EAY05139.1 hypothetical protein TVAG_151260 [Trichomonas vaginalis G3]KAI5510952.1 hypothetical protein TVAGG3_0726600 [Trichomonas vaginalis G3]|eukprot:XP_001317362.1 hypothetical protein [Trichomonas vaginalis G3]